MAAARLRVATDSWVLTERQNASNLAQQEYEEMAYPAINHIQWLNEHMGELLENSKFKILQAFKTPGKLRGAKTPAFKHTIHRRSPRKSLNIRPLATADLVNAGESSTATTITQPTQNDDAKMLQAFPDAPIPQRQEEEEEEEIEIPLAPEEPAQEEEQPPTPTPQSAVQLYTDSEIGSPSIHATPEKLLRKGSFSFAPLPARDPLKQSLGAQVTDAKTIPDIPPSSALKAGRQQSLGLDSDEDSDAESIDLRAPELIAHEERMKAYESPSPPLAPETEAITDDINDMPGLYPNLEKLHQEEVTSAAPTVLPAKEPASQKPQRLPPPKPLGRPVRPTNAPKPQPVPIKIKSLSQPKPVNSAPVAVHNQESIRIENQRPELNKKPSAQLVTPANTMNQKPQAPKVFSIAQKKKKLDEEAAAKDALVRQQQKERRDNKIEELRRNRRDEEAEKDRVARENSAEKRQQQHVTDVEEREAKRRRSEERQEHEEAAAAAKKAAFRDMQQKRQIRPATKPVAKPTIKSAIKPAPQAAPRPPNPPARPPARLDHHEASRPVSRLDLHNDDMSDMPENDLPAYPSNLSKPPVRASIKKPSIFTRTSQTLQHFPQPPSRGVPQMQQFATQRIPFATDMAPPQQNQQQARPQPQAGLNTNTPFAPMRNMHTIQAIHDTSPTDISLPEIHTDSSDDSDRDVSLPSWATPGHVFNSLSQQETINPDHVFPRIPTISMDDVFAENPDRLRRLRMRTSSANWIRTGDALTQVEVIEDRIGRQAIRNAGGWVYGLGNNGN